MTGNETTSLPDARAAEEQEVHDLEQESAADQTESRQRESNRKMACVLVGNAMLQLPIWGKFTRYL